VSQVYCSKKRCDWYMFSSHRGELIKSRPPHHQFLVYILFFENLREKVSESVLDILGQKNKGL
jgi:hypothetical protein